MFGSAFNSNKTSTFGTPSTTFGSSFGTPTQQQQQPNQGGLFGNTSNTGFGGSGTTFGATGTTNTFGSSGFGTAGATNTGSPFGAPAQTSAFGATNTGTNAFGSSTNAFGGGGSGFGGTNTGSAFGSSTGFGGTSNAFGATNTGSTFGGSSFGGGGGMNMGMGTRSVRFEAVKSDTGESYQAITAMPQYAAKSFEELRFEDYSQNVKGGGGAAAGGGAFGSTTTMGSTFGQQQQPSTTGFGATTTQSNAFGAPSTSTFGATGTSGGLFGQTTTSASPFGSTAGSTPAFGSTPSTGGGMFGGSTGTSGGGLFGQSTTGSTGLFGQSTTGPAFGSTSQPAFGSTTGSSNLFGGTSTTTPSGGLFGSSTSAPSGGLFGGTANAPTGTSAFGGSTGGNLFGGSTTASTGGLFGSSSTPSGTGGGLFGSTGNQQQSGGLFGSSTSTGGGLFGASTAPTTSTGLFGGSKTGSPFGGTSSGGLFGSNVSNQQGGGLFGASKPSTNLFGSTSTTGPSGGLFGSTSAQTSAGFSSASSTGGLFGSGGTTSGGLFGTNLNQQQSQIQPAKPAPYATGPESQMALHVALAKRAWKPVGNSGPQKILATAEKPKEQLSGTPLDTPVKALTPSSRISIRPRGQGRSYGSLVTASGGPGVDRVSQLAQSAKKGSDSQLSAQVLSPGVFDLSKKLSINKAGRDSSLKKKADAIEPVDQLAKIPSSPARHEEKGEEGRREVSTGANIVNYDDKAQSVGREGEVIDLAKEDQEDDAAGKPRSERCPQMSEQMVAEGYKLHPSMSKLREMDDVELSQVEGFEISRTGYGSVRWIGLVDVKDLIVDDVVDIENQSIEVYKSEDDTPPRGKKLNKPAICCVENLFKPPEFQGSDAEFEEWLRTSYTKEMGATFIDYDISKGRWMFKVEHFTKYSFSASAAMIHFKPAPADSPEVSAIVPTTPKEPMPIMDTIETPKLDSPREAPPPESGQSKGSPAKYSETRHLSQSPREWSSLAFGKVDNARMVSLARHQLERARKGMGKVVPPRPVEEVPSVRTEEGPTWKMMKEVGCDTRTVSMSRRFRVSWGPGGQLAFSGDNNGRVTVRRLRTAWKSAEAEETRLLEVHRECCLMNQTRRQDVEPDPEEIDPIVDVVHRYMSALEGVNAVNAEADFGYRDHRKLVLSLVNALYGHTFDGGSFAQVMEEDVPEGFDWAKLFPSSITSSRRQETLGEEALESFKIWLRQTLEMVKAKDPRADVGFNLSLQQVGKACEASLRDGNPFLATLLCQCESDEQFRGLLREQLNIWDKENCPISEACKEQFQLLSGNVESETIQRGGGWLRALALHVLHSALPLQPLRTPLTSYCNETWGNHGTQKPWPWYSREVNGEGGGVAVSEDDARVEKGLDMTYHLLKLCCDNMKYPVRRVLDTAGHVPNPLASSLSWHLHAILKGLKLFGNALTPLEESKLTMSYSLELQLAGQWKWAVYVAQFLPDPQCRARCVQELISRHIVLDPKAAEQLDFVRSQVGVEEGMISRACSYKARYEGVQALEIAYLAGAQDWIRWHEIVVGSLVPKVIADGEENIFLVVVEQARSAGLDTGRLKDWDLLGGLYELYARLKRAVSELRDSSLDIQKFLEQLEELRRRLLVASKEPSLKMREQCAAEIGTWVSTRLLELQQVLHEPPAACKEGSILDIPAWEERKKTLLTHEVMAMFDE